MSWKRQPEFIVLYCFMLALHLGVTLSLLAHLPVLLVLGVTAVALGRLLGGGGRSDDRRFVGPAHLFFIPAFLAVTLLPLGEHDRLFALYTLQALWLAFFWPDDWTGWGRKRLRRLAARLPRLNRNRAIPVPHG